MPGMDGGEATRRLRKLEEERGWPRVPVVALTANAVEAERRLCLAAGCDAFLSKPFEFGELARVTERLTRQEAAALNRAS